MGICQTRGIEPVQPFHQGNFQIENRPRNPWTTLHFKLNFHPFPNFILNLISPLSLFTSHFNQILNLPLPLFHPYLKFTLILIWPLSNSQIISDQMHENSDPKLLKINLSDLHHIKTIGKGCFSTIWLVKFDKKYFALKIYEKLKIQQLRRVFILSRRQKILANEKLPS